MAQHSGISAYAETPAPQAVAGRLPTHTAANDESPRGLSGFRISVHGEVDAVSADWKRLESRGILTPFQREAWVRAIYAHLAAARDADPVIVLVCRDADPQEPVMLLPLVLRRRGALRVIEPADLGVSDYNAPVLAADFTPGDTQWAGLWRDILAALPGADLIDIPKIPERVAGRANPLIRSDAVMATDDRAFGCPIGTPWPEYQRRLLRTATRSSLDRKSRRLADQHEMAFFVADSGSASELYETLVELRTSRFHTLGRTEPLHDPAFAGFYRDIVARGVEAGRVQLCGLKLDGEDVALVLGLIHRDHYLMIMQAFRDGPWQRYSPGLVLLRRSMQWAAEAGLAFYDFTIGNEAYKSSLGGEPHALHRLIQARSWRGRAYVATQHARSAAKRWAWLRSLAARIRRRQEGG